MRRLAIIGASDLGQLIAHHAELSGSFEVVGFFDDFRQVKSQTEHGPVLGPISEAMRHYQSGSYDCFLMGVGYKHFCFRSECFRTLRSVVPVATVVADSCSVDPSALIGSGSFLLPGCLVDASAMVGENVVLNTGCVIAHHSRVGDHCFFGPSVTLAGYVSVGDEVFLGTATTLIDGITVCSKTHTGAGTVVIDDIAEAGLYVGVPHKLVKKLS